MEILSFKEYNDMVELNEMFGLKTKSKLKDMSDLDILNILELIKNKNYMYNNEEISYNDVLNTLKNLNNFNQDPSMIMCGWIIYIVAVYNINAMNADRIKRVLKRAIKPNIMHTLYDTMSLNVRRLLQEQNMPEMIKYSTIASDILN